MGLVPQAEAVRSMSQLHEQLRAKYSPDRYAFKMREKP